MSEISVNIEAISDLKHRAVVQALLSTKLSNREIRDRLQIKRTLFYYVAGRYLPKGFLAQRSQALQLEELHNLAHPTQSPQSPSKSHDADEVTILSIPASNPETTPLSESPSGGSVPAFSCTPSKPEPQVCDSDPSQPSSPERVDLQARQLAIYRIIDGVMKDPDRGRMPTQPELRRIASQKLRICISTRDIAAAKAKWLQLHPHHFESDSATSFPLAAFEQSSKNEIASLSLEYRGVKISWQTHATDQEASILKILQGI